MAMTSVSMRVLRSVMVILLYWLATTSESMKVLRTVMASLLYLT